MKPTPKSCKRLRTRAEGRGPKKARTAPQPMRRSARIEKRRTCHLFRLPREIRDMVYDNLWDRTILRFRYLNILAGASYGKPPSPQQIDDWVKNRQALKGYGTGLPVWLLANKAILEEGLDHFHRNAIFFHFHNGSQPLGKNEPPSKCLLDLGRARSFDFSLDTRSKGGERLDVRKGTDLTGAMYNAFSFNPQTEAILQHVTDHLSAAPLQTFRMTLFCADFSGTWSLESDIHDIRSKIGLLTCLPKGMMRVEFSVYFGPILDENGFGGAIYAAVQGEMERIAKYLTDKQGRQAGEKWFCSSNGGRRRGEHVHLWQLEMTSASYRRARAYIAG